MPPGIDRFSAIRKGLLEYLVLKNPCVRQGAVVEHKRLGAALAVIQAAQAERDRSKLASRTLTLRVKDRVRATRSRAGAPPLEPPQPKDRTF